MTSKDFFFEYFGFKSIKKTKKKVSYDEVQFHINQEIEEANENLVL
jgi:hypothetical protein